MRKFFAAMLIAVAGSANANVLCEIITKDPRYHVATYIRSQTACVTTRQVGSAEVAQFGKFLVAATAVVYLTHLYKQSQIEEILAGDYKTMTCRRGTIWDRETFEFLVGERIAVNRNTGNAYDHTGNGVYERGMWTSYKLDMNNQTVRGNGLMGSVDLTCQITADVRRSLISDEE